MHYQHIFASCACILQYLLQLARCLYLFSHIMDFVIEDDIVIIVDDTSSLTKFCTVPQRSFSHALLDLGLHHTHH